MNKTVKFMLVSAAICCSVPALAGTPETKATYTAAKEKSAADYKAASAQCDAITGNPKTICVAQAKAARVQAEGQAKAEFEGTSSARVTARRDTAAADFDVAKAKCASQNGNAQDVCVKQAQASLVTAKADATADKKVADARGDARDDKDAADYKVAIEKCDGFAGPTKTACVASAKSQYGK